MDDSYLEYELCHAQSVELGQVKRIQFPPAAMDCFDYTLAYSSYFDVRFHSRPMFFQEIGHLTLRINPFS